MEKAYFIIGNARVGKSTLYLLLTGIRLQSFSINGEIKLDAKKQEDREKFIGHGAKAKTKLPNISYDQKIDSYFIDCPNFISSQGFQDQFINQYLITRLFRMVKNVKFILCITQSELVNDNKQNLIQTINGFLRIFHKQQINYDQIFQNIKIVITKKKHKSQRIFKSKKGFNQSIKKIGLQAAIYFLQQGLVNHSRILNEIFDNQKFAIFQQPISSDLIISRQFSVQKQTSKGFYKVQYHLDIKNNFASIIKYEKQKQLSSNLKIFTQQLIQKVSSLAILISSVISQVSQNVSRNINNKTYKYLQKIQKFSNQNDIYYSKFLIQDRINFINFQKSKIELWKYQYAQIIFLQQVELQFRKYDHLELKDFIFSLLKLIQKYCYLQVNKKSLYSLIYVAHQYFLQLNVIENIYQDQLKNFAIPYNRLQYFYTVRDKQIDFIQNFYPKSTYQYKEGIQIINFWQNSFRSRLSLKKLYQYQQLLNDSFKPQYKMETVIPSFIQIQIQRNQHTSPKPSKYSFNRQKIGMDFNTILKMKQMQRKIISVISHIYEVIGQSAMAYKYLSKKRIQQIQYEAQCKKFQQFIPDEVLYTWLGGICENKFDNKILAIEYYKVIRFQKKIKQLYEKILQEMTSQKKRFEMLKVYGEYLQQICLHKQAKKVYQQAFEYCEQDNDQVEILKKMQKMMSQEKIAKNNYRQNIIHHNFYKAPNNEIITRIEKIYFEKE